MDKEKKKGALFISMIIAISIVLILVLSLLIYWFVPSKTSSEFKKISAPEFSIPGLDTKFCPQGMAKIAESNNYLISGYMSDGSPSRFYVVDGENDEIIKYFTLNFEDKYYYGHAGAVVTAGSTVWTVSYDEQLNTGFAYNFMLSDINSIENGKSIVIRGYFETFNNADLAFIDNNMLWVGEFYRKGNYETKAEHRLITRSGETNPAIVCGFPIDESMQCGVGSDIPTKILSISELAQGIDVTSTGNFVVSTSYGLKDSNIYYYKDVLNESAHGTYRLGLYSIPMWYLDNESKLSSLTIPCMSEQIVINNNRVYVLFESACKKYKLFTRTRAKMVYSFSINELTK